MKNKNYIYFGLIAILALLFLAQSNTYAVESNLASKGIILDGRDNDGTSFERKDVDLAEDSVPDAVSEKGKFKGTSPRGKDISIFALWFGQMNDLWSKYVLQSR